MSDFGTFTIDRGLFDHPFFAKEPFTEREAWTWMIGRAVRTDGERRVGNLRINLRRGQLAHSGRFLAQRWGWSHSRVQRFLARLVTESMIESVTESGITCVSICNYDKYQQWHGVPDTPGGSPVGQTKEESKTTPSQDSIGDGGGMRAREAPREPMISEAAHQLAVEVMKTLAISTEFIPPGWCGLPMWLQTGLASGWKPELVRIAAAKLRAKRDYQPPYSFKYLAGPIDRAHKEFATPPLPMPPVGLRQESNHAGQQASSDWRTRNDAKHAAYQQFRAGRQAAERPRDEGDGGVVRLVPNARRS